MVESVQNFLHNLLADVRLVDLLDVALVAVFLYLCMVWLGRAASRPALVTVLLVLMLYLLARTFDMYLTAMLFQVGLTAIVLGLVLIFQEDIRRGLERLTAWGTPADLSPAATGKTVDVLTESVARLAGLQIGALLVFHGRQPLDRHIRGGVPVRADISLPLLQSIFDPHSPGHDGAVLIRGERIELLGVHLPLSENLQEVGNAGTRHTAALGLAERSDALVVVVSEERGTISVASAGRLEVLDSPAELKRRLEAYYHNLHPRDERRGVEWLTHNLGLKAAAVVAACVLWGLFALRTETVQHTFEAIPVYRGLPDGWGVDPTTVQVTVSGSERAFRMLDEQSLTMSLDMRGTRRLGRQEVAFAEEDVHLPRGLKVTQIIPNSAALTVFRTETRKLEVEVQIGKFPTGASLLDYRAEPLYVPVLLRIDGGTPPTKIPTEVLDLGNITQSQTLRVRLNLPPGVYLIDAANATVNVRLVVKKPGEATAEALKG